MKILVTGAAGFIGAAATARLSARGNHVIGVDNLSPYYDVDLKRARLAPLEGYENFTFLEGDLADEEFTRDLFSSHEPRRVVHLAAQPSARYSVAQPRVCVDANLSAFLNVLEGCRNHPVEHLVYASSSSVYGCNEQVPFSERHTTDHPVSLYAATKKANELMAHAYSHNFALPTTGLRFFTVYGPWGRPDMAPTLFANAIISGVPIRVFNRGQLLRDFTYIDDIVEALLRVVDKIPGPDPGFSPIAPVPSRSTAPYRLFNIGNSAPIPLLEFISVLEGAMGRQATLELLPMQPGDVSLTCADATALDAWVGFRPETPLEEGLARFVAWFLDYYGHTGHVTGEA